MIAPRTSAVDRPRGAGPVPPAASGGPGDLARASGLIALSLVPIIAGLLRLVELSGGAAVLPAKPTPPLPLVLHIVSASIYSVLGAFQFSAGSRRRRPGWHRAAGRILVVLGLVVALAAL